MLSHTLSRAEVDALHKRYAETGDEDAKSKLVEHYYPLVKKIAVKVAERLSWHSQPDELTSFGIDGLYRAIERFDRSRHIKFESYANQRIRGAMFDGLRRQDIVPRSVRVQSDRFERCRQAAQHRLGRRVSETEAAVDCGIGELEFQKHRQKYMPAGLASLEAPSGEPEDETIRQDSNRYLADEGCDPESRPLRREFFKKLLGEGFSDIERKIVYLYYYEGLTMLRIANIVGLSESRVSQIHKSVLERLHKKISHDPDYFGEDILAVVSRPGEQPSLT